MIVVTNRKDSFACEIGFAICLSCNQLIYTEKQISVGNYNYVGIENHWKFICIGTNYCDVNFNEYLEIKQKSVRNFSDNYAIYKYELWMHNAIKKIKHARKVGKKIRAVNIISKKWLKYMYRPGSSTAIQLANHFKLLQSIREEIRNIN